MKRAATVIAESIGFDVSEMPEYRYQRFTAPAVYAVGERYFAAYPTKPTHQVGGAWIEYADQFGARGTNQVIWVCHAGEVFK